MDRIGIIQLSDLQFGKKHSFGNPSNISKFLIHDIKSLSEKYKFEPFYIILSGDISESSNKSEYNDAEKQITILAEDLSIDNNCILCVPGNHDINQKLEKTALHIGEPNIKYYNYDQFLINMGLDSQQTSIKGQDFYPVQTDDRFALEFILVNSSEKDGNGLYYVDPEKLLNSINMLQKNGALKIMILHHRIDTNVDLENVKIKNAEEINSIIKNNQIRLVISGHIHAGKIQILKHGDQHIIYSGVGATGVNKTQRDDGVLNQYQLYILDYKRRHVKIVPRVFNPKKESPIGLGAWVPDSTFNSDEITQELTFWKRSKNKPNDIFTDQDLVIFIGIVSNPFKFRNAEKIEINRVLSLFVADDKRHKNATMLIGDSIIRGPRGSGKTMLLRYLNIYAEMNLINNITSSYSVSVLPVPVDFTTIRKDEFSSSKNSLFKVADKLVYDSVLYRLENVVQKIDSRKLKKIYDDFLNALNSDTRAISKISLVGSLFNDYFKEYFSQILLLVDEIATVFPNKFFRNGDYIHWLETIRNSGPYFTRIALYPNDKSDILAEERYGNIVNLSYDIKDDLEFIDYKEYAIALANRYLKDVSIDENDPVTLDKLIIHFNFGKHDAVEQLLYASGGSSRRFCAFLDKSIQYLSENRKNQALNKRNDSFVSDYRLNKSKVLEIIYKHAFNFLDSYNSTELEILKSIADKCREYFTFRFRCNCHHKTLGALLNRKEELNIIKIVDSFDEQEKNVYEFTYPYCIYYKLPTHKYKGKNEINEMRERVEGEWITSVVDVILNE